MPSRKAELFDHVVGAGEERFGNRKADLFRSFDVDDQLELRRLLYRKMCSKCSSSQSTPAASAASFTLSKRCAATVVMRCLYDSSVLGLCRARLQKCGRGGPCHLVPPLQCMDGLKLENNDIR
jgi:hypothetical protein